MPVIRSSCRAVAVAALLVAPLTPCGAQGAAEVVPRDLAVALLGGGPFGGASGAVQLRVGEPAPRLPAVALPPDGLLLGSASYSGRSETVAVLMQRPDEVLAAVGQRLGAAGWTRPPERTGDPFGNERRGFVPTPMGGDRAPGFCRDMDYLVPSAEPWSDGRTLLRLHLSRVREYSPCRPQPEAARPFTDADTISPVLRPPAGAEVRNLGSGGGGNYRETRAELATALTVSQLLAHYGGQMSEQGWTKVAEAAQPAVGTQLWRRLDVHGRLWFATLTLVDRPDATGRDAALLLRRDQ